MGYSEQDFLELCKKQIEQKYQPGKVDQRLKQRDFEYLADLIEETSEIKLSMSTLKRLWREKTKQNPHPSTLDALVSIIGYKDWLDFKVRNAQPNGTHEIKGPSTAETETAPIAQSAEAGTDRAFRSQGSNFFKAVANTGKRKKKTILIVSAILALTAFATIIVISFTSGIEQTPVDSDSILFTVSNTVSTGVPNTVIFNYDVSGIVADSFYIQRDWDPNNVAGIDPESNYSTHVYYLPGFHKARLIADDTVLKTEDVFIRSDGWLAAAYYTLEEPPVYVHSVQTNSGMLSIREGDLNENGANMERIQGAMLINIGDFGNLDSNNFEVETRFRLRELEAAACYGVQFTIHTEANIFFTQYGPMGCVGEIELLIGDVYRSGGNNDLSAFGTDVTEWQEVSMEVENRQTTIVLNGKTIFETTFEEDFGTVVGVDYRFDGLGDVDYLRFKQLDDTVVFEDNF